MDWLWTVGIAWWLLAIPVALLTGYLVRRLDRADARRRLAEQDSRSTRSEPIAAPTSVLRGRPRLVRGRWAGRANCPEGGAANAAQPLERAHRPQRIQDGAPSPAGTPRRPAGTGE